MNSRVVFSLAVGAYLTALSCVNAATLYVWQASPSPISPHDTWATAAHTIQEAVDAAQDGDTVLVTNGVYATGGRAVAGTLTNRVAVDRAIMLGSVNGPEVTLIEGAPAAVANDPYGNGEGAIRCVYLGTGSMLNGFTLTNGHTRTFVNVRGDQANGGGLRCEGAGVVATNCILIGNSAVRGGGVSGNTLDEMLGIPAGTLYACLVATNTASAEGGGVYGCVLYDCVLEGNSSAVMGGGMSGETHVPSQLYRCTLHGNSAQHGGGAWGGNLFACMLNGNHAESGGGGTSRSKAYNCVFVGNSARTGGGASSGSLVNCTVTANSADFGGGTSGTGLQNCIVYFNTPNNYENPGGVPRVSISYSCTAPRPVFGLGNLSDEPRFVNAAMGDYHVAYGSPCIDSGTDVSSSLPGDIEGRPRALDGNGDAVPACDMGAFEARVLFVAADSSTPLPPYSTWQTSARTIQDAVDLTQASDVVVVTNGTYMTGGRPVTDSLINRVAVDRPIVLQSLNGPDVTFIVGSEAVGGGNGDGAARCVYLDSGAILSGFTLAGGHTLAAGAAEADLSAGAIWSFGTAVNCLIQNSSAQVRGGGALGGAFYSCFFRSNTVSGEGGGACLATLYQCTVTGNAAGSTGGGVFACSAQNSIVSSNQAPTAANYDPQSGFSYSCSSPLPPGPGNVTGDPLLVDGTLRYGSPAIDAGQTMINARPLGGTSLVLDGNGDGSAEIDMGCFEFDLRTLVPLEWMQQYGIDADDPYALSRDPDQDSRTNFQEWVADTSPTLSVSYFRIDWFELNPQGLDVYFQSSANRRYTLFYCDDDAGFEASAWTSVPGQMAVQGSGGMDHLTALTVAPIRFFKVGVEVPSGTLP